MKDKKGFTLIEILVVVVIVAVLAAVSFPLYQKTIYRNRFSTLIPIAKAVANANEAYYMGANQYATNKNSLDLSVSQDAKGVNIILGNNEHSHYVLANRPDLPSNNYIIYQQNSETFASEIHCEADKNNDLANWLCENQLSGTLIEGSLTPNFNTYVLYGSGTGTISSQVHVDLSTITCEQNSNSGNKSCEITYQDDHSITKKTCNNKKNESTCTYTTYTDDGGQNVCYGNKAISLEGQCIPEGNGKYGTDYDEDGNYTQLFCHNYTSGSGCYAYGSESYDSDGTHIAASNRYCSSWDSDGRCIAYQQNKGNDHMAVFDENHKLWIRADCGVIDTEGNCLSYKGGRVEEWEFDDDGETLTYKDSTCLTMNSSLECTSYGNYKKTTYNNDNTKTEDSYTINNNTLTTKTYDANNNQTYGMQYTCSDSSGNCTTYSQTYENIFTYNEQNQETAHIRIKCTQYNASNECTKYSPESNAYRTYAADGTTLVSKTTLKCKSYTGTNCTGGWTKTEVPYVNGNEDTANQVVSTCTNVNLNTGQCVNN